MRLFKVKTFIILTLSLFTFVMPCFALEGNTKFSFGFMFQKWIDCIFVCYVFPNTPASEHLIAGDEIIEINNKKVDKLTQTECANLLNNEDLVIAKLKIRRKGKILEKELHKQNTFISDYIEVAPKLYFNWKTSQVMPNYPNYYLAWVKMLNAPYFKNYFYNSNALYAYKFWIFDCKAGYIAQIEHTEYYKDYSYYSYPSVRNFQDLKWEKVVPNSVAQRASYIACRLLEMEPSNTTKGVK